jgi:hypothetical protein
VKEWYFCLTGGLAGQVATAGDQEADLSSPHSSKLFPNVFYKVYFCKGMVSRAFFSSRVKRLPPRSLINGILFVLGVVANFLVFSLIF